jgi:aspartate aminotransferase
MVRLANAEPVTIDTGIRADFKISPAQLSAAITDRTRLLILNSPSNPTGASYSQAEIRALGAVLEQHPQIVVVADDMYEKIYWGSEPFASFATVCPNLFDRTVTVNGVSKAYAMTGWRIGYAAGPEEIIRAMATVQSQCTSNACSISQAAAGAALDGDQAIVEHMTGEYRRRHDFLVPALNEIPGIECRPGEGTFYAFPNIAGSLDRLGLTDDLQFCEYLLDQADLALVPGTAFGAPGYVRFSFACSMNDLETAVSRLEDAVAA